jgi:hypothetical protein
MRHFTLLFLASFLLTLVGAQTAKATEGDTIKVLSHQETHWNWYSSNDHWSVFPNSGETYRKIIMNYTLGCPIGGCSEWDYSTAIYIKVPTGALDSTLQTAPMFTIDNNADDSVHYANDTTYSTFFDGVNFLTDSTANTPMNIVLFNDAQNPTSATGLIVGWPVNYLNDYYDSAGNVINSIWVGADSSLYQDYHEWYNVFEKVDKVELARVITPYNGGVQNGWEHTWTFDVTDYAPILKDSVEIDAFFGGWQDGFLISIDFDMIEGTPARDPIKVNNIYHSGGGGFKYGDASDPIENYLVPVDVDIDASTVFSKMYFTATGHSFGGNENCAEFCAKTYTLNIDGSNVGSNLIWKDDCGWNPLHPQGGTWLYDRGGWCPGDKGIRWEHETSASTVAGTTQTIDIDMQAYTYTGGASFHPNYIMEGQFIEFTGANFQNDVEVYNITAPNNDFNYSRFNPICGPAKVTIRNGGEQPLTSCTITYYVVGGTYKTYEWTGNLAMLEMEEVELPMDAADYYAWGGPANAFRAVVSNPNGVADEYSFNDRYEVSFDFPPMYDNEIIIWYKPNNAPQETTLELIDESGNVVWSRGPNGLSAGTIYKDTVQLTDGCYLFDVVDSDGDGISFWANNDGGGFLRFRDGGGATIQNFNPDFGAGLVHYFTVGYVLNAPEYEVAQNLNAYPNPFNETISLEIDGFDGQDLNIQIFDLQGKLMFEETVNQPEDFVYKELNMKDLASGTYFVKVMSDAGAITKMVVKQ